MLNLKMIRHMLKETLVVADSNASSEEVVKILGIAVDVSRLAEKFEVFIPDQRNHGRSPHIS